MAEPSTACAPFQMVGARAAVLDGPIAEAIKQQIHTIESSLESVPDFAFDLSKTLVESVCKTVLADIGQPADPKWNAQRLLKETTGRLNLLPRSHPDPAKARDSVEKTLRGMLQTIQGLCELRNSYGMASPRPRRLFPAARPSPGHARRAGGGHHRVVSLVPHQGSWTVV